MLSQNELAALFRKYHEAKVKADDVKSLSTKIKNALRDIPGREATAGGFKASISPVKGSMKFDEKRFAQDYPELWEKYRYMTAGTERLNFK